MNNVLKKSGIFSVFMAMIIVLGMGISLMSSPVEAENVNKKENIDKNEELKIVSVKGKGQITVAPDIAYINLGVKVMDKDIKKAQDENTAKINSVIESVKKLGVKAEDIQTGEFMIYERYDYSRDKKNFEGYEVEHILEVKVKDISKAGEVLDKAVKSGATVVNGISFDIEKKEELYDKALKLAMARAEKKATAIMSTFGEKPGKPYKITELTTHHNAPEISLRNSDLYKEDSGDSKNVEIQSGQIIISATVDVEYTY